MTPDLTTYDVIVVNTSGGKDSQAMLDYLVELADRAGVRDRLVAVHADLGRVEWAGTRELAERQADAYGVRFLVTSRPQGDLLTHIEQRGMFPDAARRYCTSDHKTGQVARVLTALVRELGLHRQARVLNCLGMRGQESPARAKKPTFEVEKKATNGRRLVHRWLPIHGWTEAEVWARIQASGVEHHPAYDQGMPRLSCSFCVLASRGALVRAAQLRPELAEEYARVELKIGHKFRQDLSMADIIEAARTAAEPVPVEGWAA